MIRDRRGRIPMRSTVDACDARMTAVVTAPRLADTVRCAALGVPPRGAHGGGRAGGDARPLAARTARVEARGRPRRAGRRVEEEGATERDPRPELRMDEHADETATAETRRLRQVDERERRLEVIEGEPQDTADAGAREHGKRRRFHDV